MNTHPIPPAPELKDLASYLDKLPPMISRKKVAYFTGGLSLPRSWQTMTPCARGRLSGRRSGKPSYIRHPIFWPTLSRWA